MTFWAVAQTENQREKTAAMFLEDDGYEIYLPRVYANGRRRESVLFPGYLFVWIIDRYYSIEKTIGILKLLKSGDQPARVPEKEINKFKRWEDDNGVVRLPKKRELELGDPMRILRGSFQDHMALYDGMCSHQRVFVLLEFMGAQRRLELDRCDVRWMMAS